MFFLAHAMGRQASLLRIKTRKTVSITNILTKIPHLLEKIAAFLDHKQTIQLMIAIQFFKNNKKIAAKILNTKHCKFCDKKVFIFHHQNNSECKHHIIFTVP